MTEPAEEKGRALTRARIEEIRRRAEWVLERPRGFRKAWWPEKSNLADDALYLLSEIAALRAALDKAEAEAASLKRELGLALETIVELRGKR